MSRSSTNVHDDVGAALGDHRPHLFDAADRRDRFFERQHDLRRHLFGARAGQPDADVDRGRIAPREQVHAQIHEAEHAQHHQEHDQHEGEDRPLDANFR